MCFRLLTSCFSWFGNLKVKFSSKYLKIEFCYISCFSIHKQVVSRNNYPSEWSCVSADTYEDNECLAPDGGRVLVNINYCFLCQGLISSSQAVIVFLDKIRVVAKQHTSCTSKWVKCFDVTVTLALNVDCVMFRLSSPTIWYCLGQIHIYVVQGVIVWGYVTGYVIGNCKLWQHWATFLFLFTGMLKFVCPTDYCNSQFCVLINEDGVHFIYPRVRRRWTVWNTAVGLYLAMCSWRSVL